MVRVVGGVAKGRKLEGPPAEGVRPTTDMVRGAMFNMLASRYDLDGASVVDLFAGTGALGIEALSRGAASVTFVDNNQASLAVIKRNIEAIAIGKADVVRSDVLAFVSRSHEFDVAFVDPPFAFDDWAQLLRALNARLGLFESDRAIDIPPQWTVVKEKRHGDSVVVLAERESVAEGAVEGVGQ